MGTSEGGGGGDVGTGGGSKLGRLLKVSEGQEKAAFEASFHKQTDEAKVENSGGGGIRRD